MIDHQTATFHMQDFHAGTRAVDKYVHVSVLNVTPHLISYHSAEGIKAPAHICRIRIQIILHCRCEVEHPTDALEVTGTATSRGLSNRSVLHRHHWGSLSHRKSYCLLLPDQERPSTCSVPVPESGMTVSLVHYQKPLGQILFWVAIVFSTCSANNRTWTLSCAGWRNNHERLGLIPETRHRWIEIVSLLTSLVFKMKPKLKNQKDKLKYGVHRMLTVETKLVPSVQKITRLG